MKSINKSYTLFNRIPIYRTKGGRYYADVLWAKDLRFHLLYLNHFCLCCPVVDLDGEVDLNEFDEIGNLGIVEFIPLKKDEGWGSVFKNFIPNFRAVIKACKSTDIVHSGGAGWSFPLSFYIVLLRLFMSFQWVIVIESSPSLVSYGEKFSIRKWVDHRAIA